MMERKSGKSAAGKKPKLSLQKKANATKHASADKLLTLPSTDLNETSQFQQPSGRQLPSRTKASSKIVQGRPGVDDVVDSANDITDNGSVTKSDKDSGDDLAMCPACDKQFLKTSLSQHVQKCLKTKFERNINNKTDGDTDTSIEKQKAEVKEDTYLCQICKTDLSPLNSQRRAQHVNRCIDKIEDEQREAESQRKALELAKSAVLDCPMCGKPCKTENSRKTHMKKCAQENNIPTERVLMLAKQQQEEHQINIAAGNLPTFTKPKTTKSATGRRKAKQPANKLEEDIQVALALSTSLKEEENRHQHLIGQHIKQDSKSAQSLQNSTENKKQKRKKKGVDTPTPLLFVLTEEDKKQRLEEKISTLLLPVEDEGDEIDNTPTFTESKLETSTMPAASEKNSLCLWNRSILEDRMTREFNKKDLYYVATLMPPVEICNVVAGSKIKSMSQIPGRRLSTYNQITRASSQRNKETVVDDVIMASTQTAVVLAELADNEDDDCDDEDIINCSGFCPEKTIKIEPAVKTSVAENLALSLLSLVNNPTSSDIRIITAGGDVIHAHSNILSTRCPKLLELLDESRVDLSDISRDVALTVLKFVYAGDVSLKRSDILAVCQLADRLNLTELVNICTPLMRDNPSPPTMEQPDSGNDSADDNISKRRNSGVEDVATQILTNEDSLSDGEAGVIGQFADVQSDISEEDYRDILCSQRRKLSQTKIREEKEADNINMDDRIEDKVNDFERPNDERDLNVEDEIVNFFKDDSFDLTYENKSQCKISLVENMSCEMVVKKSTLDTTANEKGEHIKARQNEKSAVEVKQSMSLLKQKVNVLAISPNRSVMRGDKDVTVFSNSSSCDTTCDSSCDSNESQNLGRSSRRGLELSSKEPMNESYDENLKEKDSDIEEDKDVVIVCSGESDKHDADIELGMSESPVRNEMKVVKLKESKLNVDDTSVLDNIFDEEANAGNSYNQKRNHRLSQEIASTPCKLSPKPVCSTPNNAVLSPIRNIKTPQTPEIIDLDPEEFSDKYYTPNVRKRKRKTDTSPVKSPVAICISPKHKLGSGYKLEIDKIKEESSAQSMDVSGVDLFCTPSPAEKKINMQRSYISQNSLADSSTPSPKRLKLTPNKSIMNKQVDDQDHHMSPSNSSWYNYDLQSEQNGSKSPARNMSRQKIPYNSSPRSKLSQRNFLMKLTSSPSSSPKPSSSQQLSPRTSKRSMFNDSKTLVTIDNIRKEELHSQKQKLENVMEFKNSGQSLEVQENTLDCEKDDVQIIGDNMEELSQKSSSSPVFTSKDKVKKKWTFKTKKTTDIQYMGNVVGNSCSEIDSSCGNSKKLEKIDNSCHKTSLLELKIADEEMSTGSRSPDNKVKDVSVEMDISPTNVSGVAFSPDDDVWAGFEDSGAGFSTGIITCDSPVDCPGPVSPDENGSNSLLERNHSRRSDEDSKLSGDLDYTLPEGQIDDYSFGAEVKHSSDKDHSDKQSSEVTFDDEDGPDKEADEPLDDDVDDSIMWNEDDVPIDHDDDDVLTSESKKSLDNFKTPVVSASRKLDRKVWVPPSPFTPMADYDSMNTPMLKREVQKYGVKPVGKKRMRILLQDIYRQTHQYETDSDYEDEEDKEIKDNEEDDIDDDCEEIDFNSSQESVKSDLLEETVLPANVEEEDISSTQQLKNVKELKEKLFEFILAEPDLYTRILNYEPLEVDWLKKQVTEAGIKCSMEKLLDFLDEKCIPFTMKKMRQERASRKGRGRKKGSPKKNSPKKNSPRKKSPKKKSPKKAQQKSDK